MTIDENEIINQIKSKLSKKTLLTDFFTATDPSLTRQEKAYSLGLFIKKIKDNDIVLYRSLSNDVDSLTKIYSAINLSTYFSLKSKAHKQIKPITYEFILCLVSVIFIILGITRTFSYSILHTKSNTPVPITGISVICLGGILLWISYSLIKRRQRLKRFYLNYDEQNNG